MRKLSCIAVAVCLLCLPVFGQARRRGYTPAGGWHRKASPPVPVSKKRTDKRPPQTPPNTPAPTR